MENNAKLFAKLAAVMGEVRTLEKTGMNTYDRYSYVTADAIATKIGATLAKHSIAFLPSLVSVETAEYTTQKGGSNFRTVVNMQMTFACGESGATWSSLWSGEAIDRSDKSISKAAVSAVKYFMIKTFLLAGGDEEDADAASPVVEARQTPQDAPPPAQGKQATPTSQGPQEAATPATEDAGTPTDEEHDIISQWDGPRDAQGYAIMIGACDNEHHAGESWMASVKACRGYSQKNKREVFLHYLRDRRAKLTQLQVA